MLKSMMRRTAVVRAIITSETLIVNWADGHTSRFHHRWLRDHCPQSLHPTSGQRELPLEALSAKVKPERVFFGQTGTGGQTLEVLWPGESEATLAPHKSTFCATWLRDKCYSQEERHRRAAAKTSRRSELLALAQIDAPLPACIPYEKINADKQNPAGPQPYVLACLQQLEERGFCRISGVPASVDATRELASQLGIIQETFYGRMWDTGGAGEDDKEQADAMTDTAYSSVTLPLHTDGTYLEHQPGLQLFNCTAQPPATASEPLAGATRLADGYAVAALLRSEAPAAFEFFCRAPLPFQHVAGDVHVSATRPVFTLDRVSGDVVEFCYNETDRAPLDTLSFDDVAAFYEHEGALRRAIGRLERSVRLQPSEAIVVDNRRVMHGRFGFSGKRHLIGCYLTADDWRSRLRVLRRRAAGE